MALLFSLGFLFFSASARELLFLRSVVRTSFQFVVLTRETVEVKDFLRVLPHNDHLILTDRCTDNENSGSMCLTQFDPMPSTGAI